MTTATETTAPATCTCSLSFHGAGHFDAVSHFDSCALMVELEARIAGDLMVPSDFDQPGDPTYDMEWDGRYWRFVVHPGVDGEERCAK